MENKTKKQYISVAELANMLKISRIAIFKRIQKGQIPAQKVGRAYVIAINDVDNITNGKVTKILTENQKKIVTQAVQKTVNEYGQTLQLLGKE